LKKHMGEWPDANLEASSIVSDSIAMAGVPNPVDCRRWRYADAIRG
jgi:hypothetical protein